jgi:hypothetical protein
MIPLSAAVRQRLEMLFAEPARTQASELLERECGDGLPMTSHADLDFYDRIRLAVLKLSNGNLDTLRREIENARFDWRDVLVAAGFGSDVEAHSKWMPGGRVGS